MIQDETISHRYNNFLLPFFCNNPLFHLSFVHFLSFSLPVQLFKCSLLFFMLYSQPRWSRNVSNHLAFFGTLNGTNFSVLWTITIFLLYFGDLLAPLFGTLVWILFHILHALLPPAALLYYVLFSASISILLLSLFLSSYPLLPRYYHIIYVHFCMVHWWSR